MQLLMGLIVGAILIMRLCPELPIARTLHRHLAEVPAIWIEKADRRHLIYLLIAVGIFLFASELLATVGSMDIVLGIGWDLSLYLDILVATSIVAASVRMQETLQALRVSRSWTKLRTMSSFRLGRRERTSRPRKLFKPANNDDEHAREIMIAA